MAGFRTAAVAGRVYGASSGRLEAVWGAEKPLRRRGIESLVEVFEVVLEEVGVDVQRHHRRAVAELVLHRLDAGPALDEQRSTGVAEIMFMPKSA